MKTRFIEHIGTRAYLRVYWGEGCKPYGCHNAMIHLCDSNIIHDPDLGGKPSDYSPERWPIKCDQCGELIPHNFELLKKDGCFDSKDTVHYQVHHERLYNNPSGKPEPGDMYYETGFHSKTGTCYKGWSNCDGKHLIAILPNGHEWDIDGRASNCTMPEDKIHRCWCRHGEVPEITVDKNGFSCAAGAGSILAGDYHGFLQNGNFT
jgi:hypothetical protein